MAPLPGGTHQLRISPLTLNSGQNRLRARRRVSLRLTGVPFQYVTTAQTSYWHNHPLPARGRGVVKNLPLH